MSDDVKILVGRLVDEVWSGGDFTAVDELVSNDYVGHPSQVRGIEGYKDDFGELRRAFPDISFTIEDVISEGDKAVVRWTARGTHEGPIRGSHPPIEREWSPASMCSASATGSWPNAGGSSTSSGCCSSSD